MIPKTIEGNYRNSLEVTLNFNNCSNEIIEQFEISFCCSNNIVILCNQETLPSNLSPSESYVQKLEISYKEVPFTIIYAKI